MSSTAAPRLLTCPCAPPLPLGLRRSIENCNTLTRNYLKSIAFRFTIQLQPHPAAAATAHAVLFAHTDSQVAHPSVSHLQQQPPVVTPPPPPHPPQSLPFVQACAQRQLLLLLKWCRSFDADGTSTYVRLAPSLTPQQVQQLEGRPYYFPPPSELKTAVDDRLPKLDTAAPATPAPATPAAGLSPPAVASEKT